ncbi:NADH dehydrogenase [ubiquinone] 1 alpha subcomplex subunit 1 [Anguilla rostrata]|uniref:NADH dehydrogenase [ubiquinone] 1 alpha subcomplex subunit 1 n=1 Tax=Anguilla anguilla TaxID=7936 RepID=A0A9D3MR88_ANGAN|nr:NADH dehydrogenase [ubiquinone] 1 alpha subcomplex subunit 1 [Anguilla anguilla]KAG5851875.1 hypothetical protein ANANG_G00056460 [Anguilla anguilla]
MWYEILPGFAVMAVCLMIPGIATIHIQKFTNKKSSNSIARVPYHYYLLDRDRRLFGDGKHSAPKGLENIN